MATFQLAELRKAFADHGGVARGQKFKVEITGGPLTVPEDLQLMCDTVSLPTRSAATNELSMYGPVQSFPYRFTFTEASVNFYLTEDFALKTLFDTWQETIVDPVSGNLGYFDDYKCKINIQKFSDIDSGTTVTPDYQVTLVDAWPSIVGEVALGHSLGGDSLKLPVTLQFRKWLVGTGGNFPSGGPAGGATFT